MGQALRGLYYYGYYPPQFGARHRIDCRLADLDRWSHRIVDHIPSPDHLARFIVIQTFKTKRRNRL